ncbi:MAG: Cobalt-zinc-cadmium resistance protein CzcC precursor [Lentisphaerae bacterium ADurb.Bin242]|nr:MAG: Cobalt-zinc-cadmium resistance protein CzcC precursor [Lentisphaerae bacterium ADurb.Bin242]
MLKMGSRRYSGLMVLFLVSVFLAGCQGIQTKNEQQERKNLEVLSREYRPDGRKISLPSLDRDSTLGAFLTYAMLNQPRVEAAYYEYAASVEKITLERSLADPRFSFQMDITNMINSIMPGLMLDVPWPTKLSSRADVASAESRARYYSFARAVLETAFDVKSAYYQLHFLENRIRINREMLNLMNELEEIARLLNGAGKATLQDVIRAQIEQARLETEIANLEDSRKPLAAKLKTALGIPAGQPDPPIPARFEPVRLDMSPEQLLETAMTHNPQLKSMEAELRAAEYGIRLARLSWFPDFTFGVEGDVRTTPVMVRPKLEMTLPVWVDKITAEIVSAQARKDAASARLSLEQIQLALEIADKSFTYRESRRNLKLLSEKLIAKAEMSLNIAHAGYSAGKIEFINLLEAERTLLEFKLAEAEARTRCELALAELSLLIGVRPQGAPLPVNAAPPEKKPKI